MKVLALLVLCLNISKGYGQLAPPKQYDFTTNIIEPTATNQPFNQYGFTPQSLSLPYQFSTAQTLKPNKQNFNNHKSTNKPLAVIPKVLSTNIPVEASYQVADFVLVPSGAHAYPVQHSVEITHSDYDPFANAFVQQYKEPLPKQGNQNTPPITRPLHPQFAAPIRPQQPPTPYNAQNGFKPYVANSQNVNIRGPQLYKPYIQTPNVILPGQKLSPQSIPPNLPHNFKVVPTVAKPSHQQQQDNLGPLNKPSGFVPKPLPSPLKILPAAHVPAAGNGNSKEDTESREMVKSKPVREEEEDDDESEEESEESDEDEESGEDEDSEEKDYRPKYNYNRPVNTEFDKRNYRPTFDAAKYIFNEDNSDEDEGESEEEEESREQRPPPRKEESQSSHREQPRRQQDSYEVQAIDAGPKRPEKNIRRPQQRGATNTESREQQGKGSKFVPIRKNPYRRRYSGYYEE